MFPLFPAADVTYIAMATMSADMNEARSDLLNNSRAALIRGVADDLLRVSIFESLKDSAFTGVTLQYYQEGIGTEMFAHFKVKFPLLSSF